MGLHPAFSYSESEESLDRRAVQTFSSCWGSKVIMTRESILLENRIEEIKSGNKESISVREYNKLNKELFTINKEIEDIQSRLDACDIYFSQVTVGTLH